MRVRRRPSEHSADMASLFAGVGGFELAAKSAGIRVSAWSENDAACQRVLRERFPDALGFGDISDVSYVDLNRPKILTAGSPCQGFSLAGLRKGMLDERSGLFAEFVRIRDEGIKDGRLQYALWENVTGALSSAKGADFANVVAAMVGAPDPLYLPRFKGRSARWAGVALGPLGWFAWRTFDARHFGVAQRRHRIFGVWSPEPEAMDVLFGLDAKHEVLAVEPDVEPIPGGIAVWLFDKPDMPFNSTMVPDQAIEVKLSSVLEWDVDAKYDLSAKACAGILTRATRRDRKLPTLLDYALRMKAGEELGDPPEEVIAEFGVVPFNTAFIGSPQDRTHLRAGEPAPALTDPGRHGTAVLEGRIRGFNVDPESGQGADLKARATECAPALTSNWLEKITDRGLRLVDVLTYRVRRITPRECERLQGFPDDWTLVAGAKDSNRYRQMGNAVAVPCAAWVLARVRAVHEGRELPGLTEVLKDLPWVRSESSVVFLVTPALNGSPTSEDSSPSGTSSRGSKATSSRVVRRKPSSLGSTPRSRASA